jgi:hypothetical protein
MRRNPLFHLRRLSLDAGRWLGSWRLSIVLMVLAALYHGFLAAWAASSPPHVVANIASLLPFWLLYGLLLANTAVCLLGPRLGRLRRQLSAAPGGTDGTGPRTWARRWAPLGTYLFHGAFFLLAVGFLLTLGGRQEARLWAAEGETFTGEPGQVLSQSPPRLLAAGVPPVRFHLEKVTPELWRDQLLFTTLEAELTLASGRRAVTRINRPLWLGWGTFLRLSGFGYAPRYRLADRDGRPLDSAFVKLNVFPPGQRDYFQIPGYPHRVYVEVLPDFAVEGGEAVTRSLNLANPAVRVQIYRGRLELGEAVLRQGDALGFEGLALSFPEIRIWGELTLVHDPGVPVIFAAYLVGLAGLLLKLGGRRKPAPPGAEAEP